MKQKRNSPVAKVRVSRPRSRAPLLALPAAFGDPVPPELRAFEAEPEEALKHPRREAADTPPVRKDEERTEQR